MKLDKKAIGRRIKSIRVDDCSATMEEFANLIDSGKSNVSRWERGENLPNDLTLKKISELGNITVDELQYGEYKGRIRKVLLNIPDAKDEYINQVINYFTRTNNLYPGEEEIYEQYEDFVSVVEEVSQRKVSQELLGYRLRNAEESLYTYLNDPEEDSQYDLIKFAIEELTKASTNYEEYFEISIDKLYQRLKEMESE